MREIAVVLHNVRSTYNVGAIFRTADAVGVSRLFLAGLTPAPIDRFGRVRKDIAKTALGAETYVAWEHVRSTTRLIERLKKDGWHVIGVEQDARSRDYRKIRKRKRVVFVFGNEVRGLPASVRSACNELIQIPMHGKKESLNVSVAAGVVLFASLST